MILVFHHEFVEEERESWSGTRRPLVSQPATRRRVAVAVRRVWVQRLAFSSVKNSHRYNVQLPAQGVCGQTKPFNPDFFRDVIGSCVGLSHRGARGREEHCTPHHVRTSFTTEPPCHSHYYLFQVTYRSLSHALGIHVNHAKKCAASHFLVTRLTITRCLQRTCRIPL